MTTTLDLDAISAEFLNQCGICDLGVGSPCTCSSRDYRPTMLALVREVERLRNTMLGMADGFESYAATCADEAERVGMRSLAGQLRRAVQS